MKATRREGRMSPGLYDEPVTRATSLELETLADLGITADLEPHRAPLALARLLNTRITHALASLTGEHASKAQLALANQLLEVLHSGAPDGGVLPGDFFDPPAKELREVLEPVESPAKPQRHTRPSIPLSVSDLIVNGHHDLRFGREISKELASADRVDVLCAFLKWSGLRLILDDLKSFCARRGAENLRVLTTAYMMATEGRALDALRDLGAQVRVSYDTQGTRLHAKAWLIHRNSEYSTAFVGSSNLSAAAMLEGTEWNVRLSAIDNGAILRKFSSTFEQYWLDEGFQPYQSAEFDDAVRRSKQAHLAAYLIIDVAARPHQREMLEDLAAERARGHARNLVVAATGTGKTIVAALDYKALQKSLPRHRLLFVAHRREILDQSLKTFRVVLRDGAFGETLVAGDRPDRWEHVFASVQSLHEEALGKIAPDYFDVVIVDEFHHAAAPTYQKLLEHLKPRVLLGLTATPERADGRSVLEWFDGRVASELRLWKALDQGLLSPFQYFGVGSAPDASGVRWSRGRYDTTSLSNLYTADHIFAKRVVQEVAAKVTDVGKMRALGFCVDIAHAEFMAARFNQANIAAAAVSAKTTKTERDQHLSALRDGSLRCLFSVDLFNEGIDLPDVDTVLFLRPTESATVFLQQLGRGLRRSEGKECLTVLDFIGDANRRFHFEVPYRAILGGTRRSIEHTIKEGFPSLPSGCSIQLDQEAQRIVVDNIKAQVGNGVKALLDDLRAMVAVKGPDVTLPEFVAETGVELEDIYVHGRSWTSLRRAAGCTPSEPGPDDAQIGSAFCRILHVDDHARLEGMAALLAQPEPPIADPSDPIQRWLFILLGYRGSPFTAIADAWTALWKDPDRRAELRQLLPLLADATRRVTYPLEGGLSSVPLRVHATYRLDEVLAGFDERTTKGGVKRIQTGVFFVERLRADLLFVTLEKSETEYSPTTLYNDYAISPTRFHWETQSSCHAGTSTGQRYISTIAGAPNTALLFVRQRRKDARTETMPYVFLGNAYCVKHEGGRPMRIEWELARPMPSSLYQEIKIAAG